MWNEKGTEGLFKSITKGPRLIMDARRKMGFILNAPLIFRSGVKSDDYCSDMKGENYGRWIQKVIRLYQTCPSTSLKQITLQQVLVRKKGFNAYP